MQLTNSPVPASIQLWSWKDNVDAGVQKYTQGITTVNNHYNNSISAHPSLPALSPAQLKPAIYQYYNAGDQKNTAWYWMPNAANTGWVKNSVTAFTVYGDSAVALEQQITAGQYPSDWGPN